MKFLLILPALVFMVNRSDFSQNKFIYTVNKKFYRGTTEYYFLGFNAYYLQLVASDSSNKYMVDDTFRIAEQTGVRVIRTIAFNSSAEFSGQSVIRYSPYGLKEEGLKALDYVLFKAAQYNIDVVLTLENNFSDFGGIELYLNWADQYLSPLTGKTYSHNDFFTDDSLKNWYKYYVGKILNRTNTYTGLKYKDDPDIFSFELINEASNPGFSASIIDNWYKDMSGYFKSIDQNHLLTTGETGYETQKGNYSDPNFYYNSSYFLFNGSKGTSYTENSSTDNIDYASFHLYPDSWGFEPLAGNTWINDHIDIPGFYQKAALLGEFGVIKEKAGNYKIYFETIKNTPSRSAIIWNYVHPDLMNIADEYAFNEVQNPDLFSLFREHISHLNQNSVITDNDYFRLYQNYPNPFNPSTTIQFMLRTDAFIKVELFNSLGEQIKVIAEGFKKAGIHRLFLSFDNYLLSSGVYFYRLSAKSADGNGGNFDETRKMILLK